MPNTDPTNAPRYRARRIRSDKVSCNNDVAGDSFEIGARTDWFSHRLQLDATLFYEKWTDLQLTQSDANNIFSFVANIGAAHSQGAEVALQLLPLRGLKLVSSAARIDAVTDQFFAAPAGDVPKGTQLPGSARFSAANTLSYDVQFLDKDQG